MFLFRKKKVIVCPRCLRQISVADDTKSCPECNFVLPINYIQEYDQAPPIFIQVFGWTAAGKTMFLDTLRLTLMGRVWPHYNYRPITQLDLDHQRVLLAQIKNGQLPDSTLVKDRDKNEVYIMRLNRMERWGSRFLVVMDHAGERFETMDIPMTEIPFLLKTPTTFMLISLNDMEKGGRGEQMDQLLSIYLTAMENNGVKFAKERRKLIIVFTKADLISKLPANLKNYLINDEIWNRTQHSQQPMDANDTASYVERMGRVSDEIKRWITEDHVNAPGGYNLVSLTKDHNIETRFSLISATGQDITKDTSGKVQISPRRVLDPFFWALDFQSR